VPGGGNFTKKVEDHW